MSKAHQVSAKSNDFNPYLQIATPAMSMFPLPLTNFEEFLFRDDYKAFPNTISGRFRFRGTLDFEAAQFASLQSFKRNVMVACKVAKDGRRLVWVPTTVRADATEFVSRDEASEWPALRSIDLMQERSGRVFVTHDAQGCDVVLHGHHAALDGLGALQIMLEWMQAYHHAATGASNSLSLRPLDDSLLMSRGDFGYSRLSFIKRIPEQSLGLYGVHEYLNHRTVPLVHPGPHDVQGELPVPYPGIVSVDWTDEQTKQHHELAAAFGVSGHELLCAATVKAISHWRRQYVAGKGDDWLRLLIPINMRGFQHRRLPAANRVSFVTLDRKSYPFHEFESSARSIKGQMDVVHRNELGLTFQLMLALYRRLPGGLNRVANPRRNGGTAILTNLGEPFRRHRLVESEGKVRMGDLTLERFELMPPLRPNTHVAFSASRYAGRQSLSAAYDTRQLTEAHAKELLEVISRLAQVDSTTSDKSKRSWMTFQSPSINGS